MSPALLPRLFELEATPAAVLVLDPEGDRSRRGPGDDRDAERVQTPSGILRGELRDENGGVSQETEGSRRIEGGAAQPRQTAVNAIQRNEPDDAQEAHVHTVRPRREQRRARTRAARPHP